MKILLISLLLLSSAHTYADINQQQNQQTNTTSTSGSNNAGNAQNLTFNQEAAIIPTDTTSHVVYSGGQTIRNVPSVSGTPLTTSNDTCMGSTSGSANGPGFGVSFGSTWSDANCKMLKNSRELWNMGMKAASMALMCKDSDNREALEATGFLCYQTAALLKKAAVVQSGPDMTDPAIRARLLK